METSPQPPMQMLRKVRDPKLAGEASLLLASQQIPYWMEIEDGENLFFVEPAYYNRAEAQLELYELENRETFSKPHPSVTLEMSVSPLIYLLIPSVVYFIIGFYRDGEWLKHLGAVDAEKILNGQYWRTVTATTLHADHRHFLGNLVSGYFLLNLLVTRTGIGTAMLGTMVSAAVANFTVALMAGEQGHRSLGFSSVVFAVLGMLSAIEMAVAWKSGSKHGTGWRISAPVVAGFFMVVMLGLGEQSNVKAHFLGFIYGIPAGLIVFPFLETKTKLKTQFLLVISTWLLVAACWGMVIVYG